MIELADDLEQQPRLVAFFHPRQSNEGVAIGPHGLDPSRPLTALSIQQDELTVLSIAAGFVAFETFLLPDFGPDFVSEEDVQSRSAAGSDARLSVVRSDARGSEEACDQQDQMKISTHGQFLSHSRRLGLCPANSTKAADSGRSRKLLQGESPLNAAFYKPDAPASACIWCITKCTHSLTRRACRAGGQKSRWGEFQRGRLKARSQAGQAEYQLQQIVNLDGRAPGSAKACSRTMARATSPSGKAASL